MTIYLHMKVLSFFNHKGGVGKTTSALNVGAALSKLGHRTLLIDCDPQCNLSQGLGIFDADPSLYDSIRTGSFLPVVSILPNLGFVPSSISLASAELELVGRFSRESVLKVLLEPLLSKYDYIILDCPPSLGILNINALVASDLVIIPLQAKFFAFKGLDSLLEVIDKVKVGLNPKLGLGAVFVTLCNSNRNMTTSILNQLEEYFEHKLLTTKIRVNVSISGASSRGQNIFDYNSTSNGAIDYQNLTEELLLKTLN